MQRIVFTSIYENLYVTTKGKAKSLRLTMELLFFKKSLENSISDTTFDMKYQL